MSLAVVLERDASFALCPLDARGRSRRDPLKAWTSSFFQILVKGQTGARTVCHLLLGTFRNTITLVLHTYKQCPCVMARFHTSFSPQSQTGISGITCWSAFVPKHHLSAVIKELCPPMRHAVLSCCRCESEPTGSWTLEAREQHVSVPADSRGR